MGLNTTVVVLNDALYDIENDPGFGRRLAEAIRRVGSLGRSSDVRAGNHANAAYVVESHHADFSAIVAVGGNYGIQLTSVYSGRGPDRVKILKDLCKERLRAND